MELDSKHDAVIIGGGFYGSAIAIYLAKQRGFKRIVLVERESNLFTRASYKNQARIHNGYHYPRSFTTAYRSRINLPKFVRDWPLAVKQDFTKLYAIARRNSKVTAKQFERFCCEIGAEIRPASLAMHSLFNRQLIEDVFLVDEYAFNINELAKWASQELHSHKIEILTNTLVTSISRDRDVGLMVSAKSTDGFQKHLSSSYVFNCSYSGLNNFAGHFPGTKIKLKHEITEIALLQAPTSLIDIGVTVMDGPFFSMMPFPARGLHSLSHVRYTPHLQWTDEKSIDPYKKLEEYESVSRFNRMLRDVNRYMPSISDAKYIESLFEVKTILVKNEGDDGRPILFEKHLELPGCYSILGGKIDNIYDALEKLDAERFVSTIF